MKFKQSLDIHLKNTCQTLRQQMLKANYKFSECKFCAKSYFADFLTCHMRICVNSLRRGRGCGRKKRGNGETVKCVCGLTMCSNSVWAHSCRQLCNVSKLMGFSHLKMSSDCKTTKDLCMESQRKVNFDIILADMYSFLAHENIHVKKVGFSLFLIVRCLFRVGKSNDTGESVFSLKLGNFSLSSDNLTIKCLYAGRNYNITFKLNSAEENGVYFILNHVVDSNNPILWEVKTLLVSYLNQKFDISVDVLRRASITKAFLSIFSNQVHIDNNFKSCNDNTWIKLSQLTHHCSKYNSTKNSVLVKCYIDEKVTDLCEEMWTFKCPLKESTPYYGVYPVIEFIRKS